MGVGFVCLFYRLSFVCLRDWTVLIVICCIVVGLLTCFVCWFVPFAWFCGGLLTVVYLIVL